MTVIDEIAAAFAHRGAPSKMILESTTSPSEVNDVNHFAGKHWSEITCEDLTIYRDAIHHFSGQAFCFYLPGILIAGIKSGDRHLLVFDSIIDSLDRSPVSENWDSLFLSRWPLLSIEQCSAVQSWIFWLEEGAAGSYENSFDRCLETLELLKSYKK